MTGAFRVVDVKTAPIDGQKTGTSGLRKKVAEFKKPHYLANWVQSLFSSIDGLKGTSGAQRRLLVAGSLVGRENCFVAMGGAPLWWVGSSQAD